MTKQALLFGGTLRDKKLIDRKIERLAEALTLPVIAFRGGEGYVSKDMVFKVKMHRLKALQESEELKDEATDYEAMVYVSTVSLCQPLSRKWLNIYSYLFSQFYPEQAKEIGFPQPLNPLEERELNRLKEWIFRQQRKRR